MPFAVKLEKFEGPLDLLLQLIESEKLDISAVSLAAATENYLKYLDGRKDIPAEELADFLVVASKLLFLKSQILLPFLAGAQEETGAELEIQLRIYKEYLDASKTIERMCLMRNFLYSHDRLPHVEIGFAPPDRLTAAKMVELMREVINRLQPFVNIPKAIIEKTVSISEKIKEIQSQLARAAKLRFRSLLGSAGSRTEIVVSFLALLELIKQRTVTVSQPKIFEDIMIEKI